MLCEDVNAFGWTVLVIQVACTSNTTLSWGRGHKNRYILYSFKCFKNINWFCPGLNMLCDWLWLPKPLKSTHLISIHLLSLCNHLQFLSNFPAGFTILVGFFSTFIIIWNISNLISDFAIKC